jgi:hypothetical protein
MRIRQATTPCILLILLALTGGCGETAIDESKLYKGMDRSSIVARFGTPDARKSHGDTERLTYKDGDNYQYLLLLTDDKLIAWHHDRIFKANRFSDVRGRDLNNNQAR